MAGVTPETVKAVMNGNWFLMKKILALGSVGEQREAERFSAQGTPQWLTV